MTDAQGCMGDLIALIAHPSPVLASSNAQRRGIIQALRDRDGRLAVIAMSDRVRGTEHILSGMLPQMHTQEKQQFAPIPQSIHLA